MTSTENVPNQAIVLSQKKAIPFARNDAGGVLTTVLEHRQRIIKGLVRIVFSHNAYNTAHSYYLLNMLLATIGAD